MSAVSSETTQLIKRNASEVVVEASIEYFDLDGEFLYAQEKTSHCSCDSEGAWLGLIEFRNTEPDGSGDSATVTYLYEPSMLLVPSVLEKGTIWETSGVFTREADEGTTSEAFDYTWEAVDEVEVTTDAGTFTVLDTWKTLDGDEDYHFLESNLGDVLNRHWELTAYSP
jgi:hypothetical protein